MAKKDKKKSKSRARSSPPTDFESMVVAFCLAGRLVRGELGGAAASEAIATEVVAWRNAARAAEASLGART
jgi:hypothetical protein